LRRTQLDLDNCEHRFLLAYRATFYEIHASCAALLVLQGLPVQLLVGNGGAAALAVSSVQQDGGTARNMGEDREGGDVRAWAAHSWPSFRVKRKQCSLLPSNFSPRPA
jgi:hypothetical protein